MFYSARGLKAVRIDTDTVADGAFGRANLTSATVTLGKHVRVIGSNAFAGSDLRHLDVPPSMEFIGAGAFSGTTVPRPTNIPLVKAYASWYGGGVPARHLEPRCATHLDVGERQSVR